MLSIEDLHEQVLETLLDWQRAGAGDSTGSAAGNRLFYLRRAHDESFEHGYWFPGSSRYLVVSFWSGSDNLNRTPNAYLRLHLGQGCAAFFTARDSPDKQRFFKELRHQTPFSGYQAERTSGRWQTAERGSITEWKQVLLSYLVHDKPLLDKALQTYPAGVGAEFETKLGFLDRSGFDRSLERVLAKRLELLQSGVRQTSEQRPLRLTSSQIPKQAVGLLSLRISAYRGIHQATITELNPVARWIFLTGENGYGKTSVLRAIAQAFSSATYSHEWEAALPTTTSARPAAPNLQVEYYDAGQPRSVVRTIGFDETAGDGLAGRLVAYGPIRLGVLDAQAQNQPVRQQDNLYSLFHSLDARLYNADYELSQARLTKGNESRFTLLCHLIATVTNQRISRIVVDEYTGRVSYQETNEEGKVVATATAFEELATGYQSLINLAVDLFLRLAAGQPVRSSQQLTGLVLIDELENHLHPHLQRQLPISLRELFSQVQFVVSTHSPIPLLGAPPDAIFLRVDRTPQAGITVEQVPVDISNLLPNAILSSPIFGFQELVPISHSGQQWVQTEDSYEQVRANSAQQASIQKFLTKQKQQELLDILHRATNT